MKRVARERGREGEKRNGQGQGEGEKMERGGRKWKGETGKRRKCICVKREERRGYLLFFQDLFIPWHLLDILSANISSLFYSLSSFI